MKFRRQLDRDLLPEELNENTLITTFPNHSIFVWDKKKFKRTFLYPLNSLLTLYFNNGFLTMESFYSILNKILYKKLFSAFTTKLSFDRSNNFLSFMSSLKKVINNNKLPEDLKLYYYYYNLLNHPSLLLMHALAKKGKIPTKILLIKYTYHVYSVEHTKNSRGRAIQTRR